MYMNNVWLKDSYFFPYRYPLKWETKGKFDNIEVFSKKELRDYEKNKDDNMFKKYHSSVEEEELGKLEKMWKSRWVSLARGIKKNRQIKDGEIGDCSNMEAKTVSSTLAQAQH